MTHVKYECDMQLLTYAFTESIKTEEIGLDNFRQGSALSGIIYPPWIPVASFTNMV